MTEAGAIGGEIGDPAGPAAASAPPADRRADGRERRRAIVLASLFVATVACAAFSLGMGALPIPLERVLRVLMSAIGVGVDSIGLEERGVVLSIHRRAPQAPYSRSRHCFQGLTKSQAPMCAVAPGKMLSS